MIATKHGPLGQTAYTAYCVALYGSMNRDLHGVKMIDPQPWEKLTQQERVAWSTAAVAVRNQLRRTTATNQEGSHG